MPTVYMGPEERKRMAEGYAARLEALRSANLRLVGDLSRFDVPFERLACRITSPEEAWVYATFFISADLNPQQPGDGRVLVHSLRFTHQRRTGTCVDKAVAVCGHLLPELKPQLVYLTCEAAGHIIPVYQKNGKFGSLCTATYKELGRREAEFSSLRELLATYACSFDRYGEYDLKEMFPDYRDAAEPLVTQFRSTSYIGLAPPSVTDLI